MKNAPKIAARIGLAAVVALACCTTVQAAGTARVSTMSGSGKRVLANVDFTGPGNLRASAVMHSRPALVLRDGQAYALIGGDERPLANSTSADDANVVRPNTGDEVIGTLISLKNTGRKESRAGIPCDIYEMSFYDRDGRRRVEQIAVSNDPRAREMTDLWKSINDALLPGRIAEAGDLQKQLQANGLGLMRFSFRYQVDKLDQAVRLPPVRALAPSPEMAMASAPGPAYPSQQQAVAAQPVPTIQETPVYERVRKFTQGSIFGSLFGG